MPLSFLIGVFIAFLLGCAAAWFIVRSRGVAKHAQENLEAVFARLASDTLQKTQEQFFSLARERFAALQEQSSTELTHKKDAIASLVEEMRRDLSESKQRLEESDKSRISTFSALQQELGAQREALKDLHGTTADLKRVLSNNQLRGAFGEHVAENLLMMAGFVSGQDYVHNKEQESVSTRPDFIVYLPDQTKINVDVKFPYAALLKMSETEDKGERERYVRQFTQDVKQKIKQVTSREYINIEDRTVDFVVLFIPNEMIFSFIYSELPDVWETALRSKVVLAGPFSFTALLRMVKQAYTNFRYQENLHAVIGLIQKFEQEYAKFSESIDLLGARIEQVDKQFAAVAGTRDRALARIMDKIKSEIESPEQQAVLEKSE
ncbi:DNA recombination protein RmuC [Candidatus Uhrbacteria bacterium]|nr:DNA recombination protein RmuC [Candidatus Uhrbacteria bacterium]